MIRIRDQQNSIHDILIMLDETDESWSSPRNDGLRKVLCVCQ